MTLFSSPRTVLWVSLFCSLTMMMPVACSRSGSDESTGKTKTADQGQSPAAARQTAAGNGSGKALWVYNRSLINSKLFRIDPAARKVTHKISLEGAPRGIAAGEGAVWISDLAYGRILKVNPKSLQIESTIAVDEAPTSIVIGGGAVWVICSTKGVLQRIDPVSAKVVSSIPITNSVLTGLAYGENAVWVPSVDFRVTRVDPGSNRISAQINVIGNPTSAASVGGLIWVLNPGFKQFLKIDPATNQAIQVNFAGAVRSIVPAKGVLWLAEEGGMVSHLDVGSGEIASPFKVAGGVDALCFCEDTLWVSDSSENKVLAVEPQSGKVLAALDIDGGPAGLAFGP